MRRADKRERLSVWPLVTFLPFALYTLRVIVNRHHVFLSADLALMDMDVRRAARFQQLVGVYDRFGWHHPGPLYLYLIAIVRDVLGPTHGAQAEATTASLVDGLAAAGTVLVVQRLFGRRAGVGAAVGVVGTAVALGPVAYASAWNPNVVVLPMMLTGVLCLGAFLGSVSCLLAACVAGTFVVQTDIGTAPLVVVWGLVGAGGLLYRTRSAERTAGPRRLVVPGLLAAVAGLAWLPPVWQQLTVSPGNFTRISDFLLAHHGHAGLKTGLSAAGISTASVIGWPEPTVLLGGLDRLLVMVAVLLGAYVASRLVRERPAQLLCATAALGFVVDVAAGAALTGPPYTYLMMWAAAPAGLLLVALGQLLSRRALVLAVPTALGLVAVMCLRTVDLPAPDPNQAADTGQAQVAAIWRIAGPELTASRTPVAITLSKETFWSFGGLTDELDERDVPSVVLLPGFHRSRASRPARWLIALPTDEQLPANYAPLGILDGIRVGWATAPPTVAGQ